MKLPTRHGLVAMTLTLLAAQVQAAVDARIKQIRNQSNQTSVIELETPTAPATAFGAAAGNRASAVDKARQLLGLSQIRPQLLRGAVNAQRMAAAEDYSLIDERSSANVVRFQRTLDGIAVYGEEAIVDFDAAQNARQIVINARNGTLKQNPASALTAGQLHNRAQAQAKRLLGPDVRLGAGQHYWVAQADGSFRLQHRIDVSPTGKQVGKRYRLWLDAQNGQVQRFYTLEMDARFRTVYDLHNQDSGTATLVKAETGNVAPYTGNDSAIENLYQFFGNSYDYFWTTFGRDSFDGNGATIMSIAHMSQGFNNAFWCGCEDQYFGFGDGDGVNFKSFTGSRHVVGHEFTHAVTQNSAGLDYFALSGALNEAMSDMFGKMIEAQHNNGNVPDWLVGKELVTAQFGKPALRDMKNPHQGTTYNRFDPFADRGQPEHMDELYLGEADSRGVHVNSSLPNKMLQLLVDGGIHRNVSVSALPLADINKLLYNTLTAYLTVTSDLYAFADGMRNACQVLSGSLQTPMANCQASITAAAQSVGLVSQNLNFNVRVAGVRQVSGNNNARLDAGEQFELVLDVFNKGANVPSIAVHSSVAGGALSFDPLTFGFGGNSSFGDRYRISILGNVNQAPATNTPVTLYITAAGYNPQQIVVNMPAFGQFDPFDHLMRTYNLPSVYDLNGDGVAEIVSIDATRNKLNIHNVLSGWQAAADIATTDGNSAHSAYQVAIDDFGVNDVRIVSVEDFGRVATYNAQAVRLNSFGVAGSNTINLWGSPSPVIADLDGDGSKEIIVVTPEAHNADYSTIQNTRVYVFDKNLNVKSGWPRLIDDSVGLAVGDLDGDGKKEIIVSTYTQVIAMDHLAQNKSGWPWSIPNAPAYPVHPALADVNNDGKLEVFLGNSNESRIYALQSNGTVLAGFPKTLPAGVSGDRVIPADVDGDGQYELVLGTSPMGSNIRGTATFNTNVQPAVMSMAGTLLSGWPKKTPLFSPMVADVTGDGRLDIVGGDLSGVLHAYSINGVQQPGFPLDPANGWRNAVGGGVLGDANGDGLLDLVYTEYNPASFGGSNGFGLLHLKQPYNPAKLLWAMPERTAQNTAAPAPVGLAALNYRGTTNSWGVTPMRRQANNLWSIVVTIPGTASDRFKLDASTTWAQAWGDTNKDGIAAVGEADIYFNRPAGTYVIKFNDQTRAYSITAAVNQAPVANVGASNATAVANQALSLDGSASYDPEGATLSCAWSEVTATGEQAIGNSCVSSRTFSSEGNYLLKLLVTDSQGLTATAYKTVTVAAASTWQRTVIFVQATTSPGQNMFIRGGIDHAYAQSALGRTCTQANMACAVPIRHRNLKNATTNPWKSNDNYLDWYGFEPTQSSAAQGTPLDWTTNNSSYANTVAVQGYGYTPLNTWGEHQWMLDVDMDCSKTVNGWFELKSFISNGPGWEANVTQAGAPYVTGNHFAQCGKLNRFISGQGTVTIQNLP